MKSLRSRFLKRGGFTLLEVAIATAVLALVTAGLLTGLVVALKTAATSETTDTAVRLGVAELEYVLTQPYTEPPVYLIVSPIPADYTVTMNPSVVTPGSLQQIQVTVQYKGTTYYQSSIYKTANPNTENTQ